MADEKTPEVIALEKQIAEMKAEHEREAEKNRKTIENLTKENADKKRELAAKMTEQEKAEAERAERDAAIIAELETLRKEKALSEGKATFLSLGMSDEQAKSASEAFLGGDIAKFSTAFSAYMKAHDEAVEAARVKGAPKPPVGGATKSYTREDLGKMSYAEREKLYTEQPEVYAELTK